MENTNPGLASVYKGDQLRSAHLRCHSCLAFLLVVQPYLNVFADEVGIKSYLLQDILRDHLRSL